jgi:hypothetical protein
MVQWNCMPRPSEVQYPSAWMPKRKFRLGCAVAPPPSLTER